MDDYKPISQKELERGYFFVSHRLLLKKIIFLLSLLVLVIFYGILIFRTVKYFMGTSFSDLALEIQQSTYDFASYHSQRMPQNIILGQPEFTSLGDRRYNIVAMVENPNQDWAVKSIDYHFVSQGEASPSKTVFINPGEKRLLALTAYESNKAIRNPELVVSNIEWYRIDNSFPQIDIEVTDVTFQAASRQTIDGVTSDFPARVLWKAYNNSVYNFWEIDWQVALYNSDKLVAINEIKTKDFLALENRDLEAVWLIQLPRVTRAAVLPIINKLDRNIFKDIYVTPKLETE